MASFLKNTKCFLADNTASCLRKITCQFSVGVIVKVGYISLIFLMSPLNRRGALFKAILCPLSTSASSLLQHTMLESFSMQKAPSEAMPLSYWMEANLLTPAHSLPPLPSTPPSLSDDPGSEGTCVLDGIDQRETPTKLAVSVSPVSISDKERS